MLMQIRFIFFLPVLLMLACSITTKQPEPETKDDTSLLQVRPSASTTPAVLNLLDKARSAAKAGQFERAEVQLERALRIEPDNATLWHYMAKLRLHQGQLDQAAGLAAKSNSMEHEDRILQADNWRIIAHARFQQGNTRGAQEAQARADALSTD